MAAPVQAARASVSSLRTLWWHGARLRLFHGRLIGSYRQAFDLPQRRAYCLSKDTPGASSSHSSFCSRGTLQEGDADVFEHFAWVSDRAPGFWVSGNQITVLKGPQEYFETLKERMETCRRRVVLAALYLGTGTQEEELVVSLYEACRRSRLANSSTPLEVQILLDCTRGSRGKHNSRTMLLPLLRNFQPEVRVSLYHTPDLRGFLKKMIPERYNEVIGLSHLKVCIFDDTLIISGANLSESYFTNRQDRYVMLEDCPRLADFFQELVSTVSSFSFQLNPDDSLTLDPEVGIHPYEGDELNFKQVARDRIQEVIDPSKWDQFGGHMTKPRHSSHSQETRHSHRQSICRKQRHPNDEITTWESYRGMHKDVTSSTDMTAGLIGTHLPCSGTSKFLRTKKNDGTESTSSCIASNSESCIQSVKLPKQSQCGSQPTSSNSNSHRNQVGDTLVFPLIQMGSFGVTVDQDVTCQLLKSAEESSHLALASGYFNLTREYMDLVLGSKATYSILMASPEANGFFGARGISGYVPAAYTFIARNFLRKVRWRNKADKISMHEYFRQGWTFHVKGLWYYLHGESLPSLTLIGSPNFGHRSVHRDLEAQLAIVTTNDKLQNQLHQERQDFFNQSEVITSSTFRRQERRVPLWAKIFTLVARNFF
ncbi:CDP-diacylglycerol--glycerol-3-phosphate 3-phosphatidyltransferase, mitochondrial-like [Acanthaster planci]|uniref:CDP-diacylglycerol--glycerol-3-phosphate 3-phosphatidyltransferase n=1 Tax=Acanthaster planci TaxID=133434 RepID=A0A8B7XYZ7_ACAPL|nr:CDP-diacylglycerol--glycerol-3-phosphate 3-phosphatidyltransferase, mitochondrial-like [Acanthaster planci]